MPLIVLCGYPSCGKTTFANALAVYLKEHAGVTALVANEESLLLNKRTAYQDATKEKLTRGVLKSYVDQKLNNRSVVILDSLNYIKGFRYELHCMSRELRSSHCVVWVRSDERLAEDWNRSRPEECSYEDSLFFELRQRFEAPNSSNRWDFPLFHVDMTPAGFDSRQFEAVLSGLASAAVSTPPSESLSAANQPPPVPVSGIIVEPVNKKPSAFRRTPRKTVEPSADPPAIDVEIGQLPVGELSVPITTVFTPKHQKLTFSGTVRDDYTASSASVIADTSENFLAEDASPEHCCELIRNFIKTAVAPAPNPATVATPHLKANMLYLLDKISQEVVTTIVNHQNISANATDPLLFTDYDRALELHRVVSLAELQRHRRQFVKVNAQIPPCNQIDIGSSFIEFLALHI